MRHLFWGGVHPAGRKELSRGAAPTPAPFQARSSSQWFSTSASPVPLWSRRESQ
ncbi:MAG: hypothetical protein ACLRNQ_28480 [Flavonifractor plautii]